MVELQVSKSSVVSCDTLIDLGANNNFISQEVWKILPQVPLTSICALVCLINGNSLKVLGSITLPIHVNNHELTWKFHVMPTCLLVEENMVLGRTWCYQVNRQIDWRTPMATLTNDGRTSIIELIKEDDSSTAQVQVLKPVALNSYKGLHQTAQPRVPNTTNKVWVEKDLLKS